eukprot:TRINITY_DN15612_c0_g1_i1.p1 TRINITY_DN15612_c0_g1~~TRINITY_DN15612_c0_g1_i1.p1  ORF type:complete len:197 (-),score=21.46 TRINITY_DN15612_c0_g1_i1:115-705(-)
MLRCEVDAFKEAKNQKMYEEDSQSEEERKVYHYLGSSVLFKRTNIELSQTPEMVELKTKSQKTFNRTFIFSRDNNYSKHIDISLADTWFQCFLAGHIKEVVYGVHDNFNLEYLQHISVIDILGRSTIDPIRNLNMLCDLLSDLKSKVKEGYRYSLYFEPKDSLLLLMKHQTEKPSVVPPYFVADFRTSEINNNASD